MIRRIFLDIDGVLNRFITYALKHVGCPIEIHEDHKYPVDAGWSTHIAANMILREERFTKDSFWRLITRDVWRSCPMSHEAYWLIGHAEMLVGKDNVCILTTPTIDPECLAGKLEWIHERLPSWLHRQYLMGPRKEFCARPDSLLIDDGDHNVNDFRASGGQAILVPRPWNTNHGKNTIDHLLQEFDQIMQDRVIHSD